MAEQVGHGLAQDPSEDVLDGVANNGKQEQYQWSPNAVEVEPFEAVPVDLHMLLGGHTGSHSTQAELRQLSYLGQIWLLGALAATGVAVGAYDREVALVIAEEGTTLVQVVAGWIVRSNPSASRGD